MQDIDIVALEGLGKGGRWQILLRRALIEATRLCGRLTSFFKFRKEEFLK